ncbi:MAG: YceI family protein [Flavobacteriaceae bacterium]|nr:YceI family protein [Flavobacteriaceae bacterium]
MKNLVKIKMTILLLALLAVTTGYSQDSNQQTQISFNVNNGPVFPIEGSSNQIKGSAHVNDKTLYVENMSFKVPLNTFIGMHAGYLAWIGNANMYPDLEFNGTKAVKNEDGTYNVKGQIRFRGTSAPQLINVTENTSGNEIILKGSFQLNTSDYFIVSPPMDLVPAWIPIQFTLVFDKAAVTS